MDPSEFANAVRRGAPPDIPPSSLNQAILEFITNKKTHQGHVADCIQRARELGRDYEGRVLASGPRRADRITRDTLAIRDHARRMLSDWAGPLRQRLFDSPDPPFNTIEDAAKRLASQAQPDRRRRTTPRIVNLRRAMFKAMGALHKSGDGWWEIQYVDHTIPLRTSPKTVQDFRISPNADPALIVLEREIRDTSNALGIATSVVAEYVLVGRFDEGSVKPVTWELSGALVGGQLALRGHLTLNVRDVPQADLKETLRDLLRKWRAPKRASVMNPQLMRLLIYVQAAGGPPRKQQQQFWARQTRKAGYKTWSAAKQAYWRTTPAGQRNAAKTPGTKRQRVRH